MSTPHSPSPLRPYPDPDAAPTAPLHSLPPVLPARAVPPRHSSGFGRGLLVLAAIACTACDSAARNPGPGTADSVGVRIVTNDPLSSDATCRAGEEPIFRVGDSEDDENQWFSTIRGMGLLSDGSVAVIDRSSEEVRVFGPDGSHLVSMGRPGDGPGEFRSAWFLWVLPGDTLWVGDYRPWHYNVFTRDGQFVRAVQMMPPYANPSRRGGVLRNGISVNTRTTYVASSNFTVPDTLLLEAHDDEGRLVTTLARVPNMIEGMTAKSEAANLVLNPLFAASAHADAIGSTIATGHGRDPEVRLFDDDLRLRRIVRWSEPSRQVTSAEVSAWRDNYVESRGGRDSDRWGPFDEAIIDPDRPAADVYPAFSSLKLGTDGRLWVAPYRKAGQEARRWMAFEPDGTFSCHLERVPISIHEIGADYVLGIQSDELGVQTVVMYSLGRPQPGTP